MTWLTRAAVDRRSVTILLAVGLFIFGVIAWGSLKQELLPDVSFPVATVIAPFPGASAEDVADQVVAPIERAVQSVSGIDQVRSTSANSIGFITAQFEYGTDVDEATAAMEEAIASLTLPEGVDPAVSALNLNASPVVIAAISSETATLSELGQIASDQIVPELEGISGVGDVEITGGLEDEVTITLDPVALAQSGIAYPQIQAALAASSVTIPAGELPSEDESIPVTVIGEISGTDELEAIVVGVNQAGEVPTPVTLGDLATVETVERATTGYARINGQEALSLTVSKTASANTVEVSQAVNDALDEIVADSDGDLEILRVSDQADFIIESRDGLLREGGLGALFAVLTIFAFLLSLRSTFVAAMSIPLSLLVALVLMQVTGITMNIMTLGGLAVAVGRVVDDSVVVLENIYRHRAMGEDRRTAVLGGAREVAGAITWSTLTTVAVFLPLGFAGGLISQFFLPFALTVSFALLASLVVALTVVPVLAYFLVSRPSGPVDPDGEPKRSIWVRLYDPTIRAVLRNRWTALATVGGALLLFIGSLFLVPLLPTGFINSGSEKILVVSVSPPAGASSEAVIEMAAEAEAIILADDEVELVQTSVPPEGDTGFRTLISAQAGRAANSATIFVRLDQESDLDAAAVRLEDSLGEIETDGWDAIVQQNTGPSAGGNLAIVVGGADLDAVEAGTETVVAAISDVDGLANVTSDLVAAAPTVEVRVDADRAAAVGVSAGQVGGVVRAVLTPTSVTTIQPEDADEPVAVLLRFDPSSVDSTEALASLPVAPGRHARRRRRHRGGRRTRHDLARQCDSVGDGERRDHQRRHRRCLRGGQRRARPARVLRRPARRRLGRHRRGQRAAGRGVRRPLHGHGRGDRARLPRARAGVRIVDHAVHHPVQPSAGHDRRLPGAAHHRPAHRDQRADRLPDAHRHRGHERDRAPRPRRAAPCRGRAIEGSAHSWWSHPRATDPHDGDRDDPRARAVGGRVQRGVDHRRRARDGGHRRPAELDVPDAHRRAGRVPAGGGLAGAAPEGRASAFGPASAS